MKKVWTTEMESLLRLNYYNSSWCELENLFGLTRSSIKDKATRLKLKRNKSFQKPTQVWTKDKDLLFKDAFAKANSISELAQLMNITVSATKNRCFKLKLTGKFQRASFAKGHETWNKGKKGWSPQGNEHTRFKKGNKPHNTKPGDKIIVLRKQDNYEEPYIRISVGKWKRLAVYNYEQEFGAVPPGHVIRVKDGNPLNTGIRNLICISRKEHYRLNRFNKNEKNDAVISDDKYLAKNETTKPSHALHLKYSNSYV